MTQDQLCDHEVGLELQLIEAVEQHERAIRQGRTSDAARLHDEITQLQSELAAAAEEVLRATDAAA